eukprot:scaffold14814_cov22-Tisochrysis_lutea.AAC.1
MDYASEQQMELEALEAIYMDELQVRAHNHARTCTQAHACRHAGANVEGKVSIDKWWSTFQVWVTSEHVQIGAHASTRKRTHARTHTHTHTHMRAHTCIRKHTCNQEYCQIKHAYDELPIVWTPVEENKGMPMIYTLVTAAKECELGTECLYRMLKHSLIDHSSPPCASSPAGTLKKLETLSCA